jgi:hypothetical protein
MANPASQLNQPLSLEVIKVMDKLRALAGIKFSDDSANIDY